jgi:hypothetical protein
LEKRPIEDESLRWCGRVTHLANRYLELGDRAELSVAVKSICRGQSREYASVIRMLVHRAIASAEAECGDEAFPSGSVINPGEAFRAFTDLAAVISGAQKNLWVVDPYMDDSVLRKYAVTSRDGIEIRLLTESKKQRYLDALKAACDAWMTHYGSTRPIQARIAPEDLLHDRMIFVDDDAVWLLSQSIKDFAAKSPATLLPIAIDLVQPKRDAYEKIWSLSSALI